jgi:hypothetical protein
MTDHERTCAYLPCPNTFHSKRSDARYCSPSCRSADRRMRDADGYDPKMAQGFWEGYRSVQRRARERIGAVS